MPNPGNCSPARIQARCRAASLVFSRPGALDKVLGPPNHCIILSRRLLEIVNKSLPGVQATVIPTSVLMPAPCELRKEEILRVGFLGNFDDGRKGELDLIKALSLCKNDRIVLLLAGDGPSRQSAEKLAADLGVSSQLRVMGRLSDDEKRSFYQSIHVFCLPSHAENLPAVLLEAMSYGRPVISCPVGGIAEVVRHKVNGWLVPPSNPTCLASTLAGILDSPGDLLPMGQAARNLISTNFTWDVNGPKYVALYRTLTSRR